MSLSTTCGRGSILSGLSDVSVRRSGLFQPLFSWNNDLLIALTARHIGATVVTNNLNEFRRIGKYVPWLAVIAPEQGAGS